MFERDDLSMAGLTVYVMSESVALMLLVMDFVRSLSVCCVTVTEWECNSSFVNRRKGDFTLVGAKVLNGSFVMDEDRVWSVVNWSNGPCSIDAPDGDTSCFVVVE